MKDQSKLHAKTDGDLATMLGCNRETVVRYKRAEWHPTKTSQGWPVDDCRAAYLAAGHLKERAAARASGADTGDIAARKLKAEMRKEEARAGILSMREHRERGKILPVEAVTDSLTEILGEVVAKLRAIPATVGPLAGTAGPERAEVMMQDAIDTALSDLAKLEWITPELKKKVKMLGESISQQSAGFFDRPQLSAPSAGSVPT